MSSTCSSVSRQITRSKSSRDGITSPGVVERESLRVAGRADAGGFQHDRLGVDTDTGLDDSAVMEVTEQPTVRAADVDGGAEHTMADQLEHRVAPSVVRPAGQGRATTEDPVVIGAEHPGRCFRRGPGRVLSLVVGTGHRPTVPGRIRNGPCPPGGTPTVADEWSDGTG